MEKYSIQDFICKAIAGANDSSLSELLHHFNHTANGITLLCVFPKPFCALFVFSIKFPARRDARTVVCIEFTDT